MLALPLLLSLLAPTTDHAGSRRAPSASLPTDHGQYREHRQHHDAVLGHGSDTDSVSQLALTDGRRIGDLLDSEQATVVLFYAPSDCFSCTGTLGRWVALEKSRKIDIKLVLTEDPTPRQVASLAFLRIESAGVLAPGLPEQSAPAAHVFEGATWTTSAVGVRQQNTLLDELTMPSSAQHPSPHTPHRRQAS